MSHFFLPSASSQRYQCLLRSQEEDFIQGDQEADLPIRQLSTRHQRQLLHERAERPRAGRGGRSKGALIRIVFSRSDRCPHSCTSSCTHFYSHITRVSHLQLCFPPPPVHGGRGGSAPQQPPDGGPALHLPAHGVQGHGQEHHR